MSVTVIITFIIYLAMMLGVGIMAYRRTQDLSDFILGGRQLGPWTTALSAGASDMSGWLLMGLPGAAYASGLSSLWIGLGLFIGTWMNWQIVARRLRVYSCETDTLTLPGFFAARFHDKGHLLRLVSASFILLFFLFYTSSGLVAGGKLFETVFGLDYKIAVVAGAVAVISYTLFGGFLAVSWTDLIQGLLMAAALIIVPITALNTHGGIGSVLTTVKANNPELLNIFTNASGESLTLMAVVSSMAWGLGYAGQPHILARFKAIRSNHEIPAARRIAVSWTALGLIGAVLVGVTGMVCMDSTLDDPEKIFMALVNSLFHPAVAGILLAAILAAIMSTADSQLLVSSSAFTDDFYKSLLRKDASEKELIWVGRLSVIALSVVATVLALNPASGVLDLVSYAWAGFGAAFGPALILSLYWRRTTKAGVMAGILSGGIMVVVWKQLSGGIFDLYEIVPGFLLAFIAIIGVSLMSAPCAETVKTFDRVEALLNDDEDDDDTDCDLGLVPDAM